MQKYSKQFWNNEKTCCYLVSNDCYQLFVECENLNIKELHFEHTDQFKKTKQIRIIPIEEHIIIWHFNIRTNIRPDLSLVNKKKTWQTMDFAVLAHYRVDSKESEKIDIYLIFVMELTR